VVRERGRWRIGSWRSKWGLGTIPGLLLRSDSGFEQGIQIRADSFTGERPRCPRACPGRLHRHGCYRRYGRPEGNERFGVQRYWCPDCGLTVSVLPVERLPYRPLEGARVEAFFQCAGGDQVRTRSAAWPTRSRVPASSLDSLPDQSSPPKRSLWSADSERDFRGGRSVEADASSQGNTARHSGVSGSKLQHLAVGRLSLCAAALSSALSRGRLWDGAGPIDPTQGFVFRPADPGADWRA